MDSGNGNIQNPNQPQPQNKNTNPQQNQKQRNNQNKDTIFFTVHTFGNDYKVLEISRANNNYYFIDITTGTKGDTSTRHTLRMKLNKYELAKMTLDLFGTLVGRRYDNGTGEPIYSTIHTFGKNYKVFEIVKENGNYFIQFTSGVKGDTSTRQTVRMKLNEFELAKMTLDMFAEFIH